MNELKQIHFQEHEERIERLDDNDAQLLINRFSKYLKVEKYGEGQYKLITSQFIGIIVLLKNVIIIKPKMDNLSFSYMFSYTNQFNVFRKEDFDYVKKHDMSLFEHIVRNLLRRVDELCKKGISKAYYEMEENLPYVKGKVLITKDIIINGMLHHRVYCNYSDYRPDNLENQIIKYTLFYLLRMEFERKDLYRTIKLLLHYFESVSSIPTFNFKIPVINYTRLTKQYEVIIDLCRLILSNASLSLEANGKVKFSSFLIDMNTLFEDFIIGVLKSRLSPKLTIKTGKQATGYSDEQKKTRTKPDIVIKKGRKPILIIDAKYKDSVTDDDLNQIWIYSLVNRLPVSVLVYPGFGTTSDETRTLAGYGVDAAISYIDLFKNDYELFEKECDKFCHYIEHTICKRN